MSTFITLPKDFTVLANSNSVSPTNFLKIDEAGLVWRTTAQANNYITVQLPAGSTDIVALAGTNLTGSDQIRIRMGDTQAQVNGSSAPLDQTTSIQSGTAPTGSFLVHRLENPVNHTFLRIDFPVLSNPFLEVSRLIIGQSIQGLGVDIGAEYSFENRTISYLDQYETKPTWKVNISGLTDAEFWTEWAPALRQIAKKTGFLFVPDFSDPLFQEKTIFGYQTAIVKSTLESTDYTNIELSVQSLL